MADILTTSFFTSTGTAIKQFYLIHYKAVSPYERGVVRGAMHSVMGMRDESLQMRVINFSALRCPGDFTDCTQAVVCQVT